MLRYLSSSFLFSTPRNATITLVAFFSLLHLFTMGQIELTNDEAHYALFAYYLDWSYFDHPPLIGWLNAIALYFSSSEFSLRVIPLLLAILTSYLLYNFSRALFPQHSPWLAAVAVLFYQSSLVTHAFTYAMLPDTPLIPVAVASMWLLHRSLSQQKPELWIYIGLLFGLAGLSKYTAITLVITALLGIIIYKQYAVLKSRWPWIGVMIAMLVISPVLYWNMQHDWISIKFQLHHGVPEKPWLITNIIIAQLGQFILYTPVVYITGLLATISVLKNRNASREEKFILAFSLPVLLLFTFSGGYERTLPHWPALGWIALSPLMAKWLIEHWQSKTVRIFGYGGFSLSFILIITLSLAMATNLLPFKEDRHPLSDIYGWKEAGEQAVKLQKQMQQETGKPAYIFVSNWSHFARVAWYIRPVPVKVADLRFGQFTLWYGNADTGENGILFIPSGYQYRPTEIFKRFERCEEQQPYTYKLDNKVATTYRFYKCYSYRKN